VSKLRKAATNASIYHIPKEKIVFIHDNACHILSSYKDGKLVVSNDDDTPPAKNDYQNGYPIGRSTLLPKTINCIFLSPPWGGIDYGKVGKRNYTLSCIKIDGGGEGSFSDNREKINSKVDGDEILRLTSSSLGREGPIAIFLPRNINGVSLGRSVLKAGYDGPVVLEQNVVNGKLKTVTAYLGLL
jgi:hypothetical protein